MNRCHTCRSMLHNDPCPMGDDMTQKSEYGRDEPVALDDRDPSNSDPENLTAPLAPDDDVFMLVSQEQGDVREAAPVGDDPA